MLKVGDKVVVRPDELGMVIKPLHVGLVLTGCDKYGYHNILWCGNVRFFYLPYRLLKVG